MIGARNIIPVPVLWPLDGLGEWLPIRFQFIPDSFTREVGSDYAEASSLNREHPVIQFTKGKLETFSFDAKLFSNSLIEIGPNILLPLLIKATKRDETLKRPPLWMFVWGSAVQETVVIKSLGGIKYGPLRPDGLIRDVTLSIELARYEPFDTKLTGVGNKPEGNTFNKMMKSGTFWEGVSLAAYATAAFGSVLAQLQNQAVPVGGQSVTLPAKNVMLRANVSPKAAALVRTDDGIKAQSDVFALRGQHPKTSTVLKRGT